jgi:hypothetical protein
MDHELLGAARTSLNRIFGSCVVVLRRLLIGTSSIRQGWYEFTEKMIRGYVRLKAEQANIILEVDHPALKRRIKSSPNLTD